MLIYYLKIVVTVALIAVGYGFVVPMAVSEANTTVVLAGFGIAFLLPVIIYSMWSTDIANLIKAAKDYTEVPEPVIAAKGNKKKSSA